MCTFTELQSCTRFAAHNEMCEFIESLDDSVIDFSFRGRDNYFLLENVASDETITRYILYVFLICTEEKGWVMRAVSEMEKIPNTNCPVRLLRQSNVQEPSAKEWRSMIMRIEDQRKLEQLSIKAEATNTCICRLKKPTGAMSEGKESIYSAKAHH